MWYKKRDIRDGCPVFCGIKGRWGAGLGKAAVNKAWKVSTGATNIGVISSEGVAEVEKSLDTSEGRKKTILGTHSVLKNEKCHGDSNSCSATSIVALLAWSASHCSFRLTRSPRFRLRRMTHWVTSRLAPPSTAFGSVGTGVPKPPGRHKKADHREGDPFFCGA